MQESALIIPTFDNEGQPLNHLLDAAMLRMVDAFGGVTAIPAKGAWRDNGSGNLHIEPVTQLVSAYEPSPENDARLKEIGEWARVNARQIELYVRYASGNVEFLK